MSDAVLIASLGLFAASMGYGLFALARVVFFARRLQHGVTRAVTQPVTLLKPLCGLEPEFADNLRSFCRQDYPAYQIVFGVRDPADPAIAVVNALKAEFPERAIALVVDEAAHGVNLKVSNLVNMMAAAEHDLLVISDSDMRVEPNYIDAVVTPFARPEVGAVTCLYSGTARGRIASKLGAMFINDWFLPSSLIPIGLGELDFCFGATMAIRRPVLDGFGGFAALAPYIADDYMLGRLAARNGHKIAVAPYIIENVIEEEGFKSLFSHEIRWARTIRSVQPVGYAFSFVTDTVPLSVLAGASLYGATESLGFSLVPLAMALVLRYAVHHIVTAIRPSGGTYAPWLIPVRDFLTLAVRVTSFFGSKVQWREQVMVIERNSVSHNSPD